MYINLLNHSNYSLLSSSLKIADIIKNSLENNSKFCSLIDIDTMFQTLEFYKLCEKNNLIPIIGLQINYLNDTLGIFALNNEGLSNLYKISNLVSKKEYGNIFKLLNNTIVISYNNKKNELIEKNCSFYYFFNELSIKENYCEKKEDLEILQALYAIKNSISLEEAEKEFIIMEPHFLSKEEYENKYSNEQKEKLLDLVSKINIKIEKKAKIDFVKFSNDSRKEIRELCEYGLFKKEKNKDEKYIKRMNYELSIIDKMGFNDYFLVIRDFIQFAKKNNIFTGPGRGSAAGSLVSYLLDITMVDPVSNNLIFERFLNIDRNDMPDIDVDIEDSERMKVINYLFEKYGKNNVAHIVTFQRMKTKMALTDVGRILKIELSTIKNITSLFGVQIDDSSIEKAIEQSEKIKKQAQNFPQLFKIANQIINFPRNIGVHAAGIVLCESNLINKVPTLEVNGKTLIQYEGSFLEPLGLVKLDILGLSNLTIVKDIIELIKQNEDLEIDLTKINLEVPQVYSQLSSGDTIGIFQLESSGMTNTIKKVKPKCLEDLSIVLALYRPGAVENMNLYLENKKDSSKIKYLNDSFEKILGSTFNIPIYQEQIMELIKSTANYSYSKADIFRRIISKKKIEQLKEMKKDFLNDALLNNFSLKEANEIFAYIEKFTGYGFNHSHSLAYATLSYWMTYLKYYYPIEFLTVILSNSGSSEKINDYINEAKRLNVIVTPPNILDSENNFSIKQKKIIFGFNQIKGLGNVNCEKILKSQKKIKEKGKKDIFLIFNILGSFGITLSIFEILIYSGVFDIIEPNRKFLINNLQEIFTKTKTMLADGTFLFSLELKEQKIEVSDEEEFNKKQLDLLGYSFSKNKKDLFFETERTKKNTLKSISFINNSDLGKYEVLGKILKIKEVTTKYGGKMCFANILDDTSEMKLTMWPGVFEKYKTFLVENSYLIFIVIKNEKGNIVNSITTLN